MLEKAAIIFNHCVLCDLSEVTIGNIIIGSVGMDRFVYFFLPFFSSGITIRIEARLGGIRCYASDVDRRPSSTSNVWNLLITDYGDSFIDPSTLGRTPGSTLFIALQGVNVANNFTMNTTIGDTSIQGMYIGWLGWESETPVIILIKASKVLKVCLLFFHKMHATLIMCDSIY